MSTPHIEHFVDERGNFIYRAEFEGSFLSKDEAKELGKCVSGILDENAKLRELVRDMWHDGMCECDEREATLGRGTCHPIISDNLNESEGMGDAWANCSECGYLLCVLTDPSSQMPNFCPNCGRKVINS